MNRPTVISLKYACLLLIICFIGCLTWTRYVASRYICQSSPGAVLVGLPHPPKLFTAEEVIFFTTGKGDAQRHEPRLKEYVRTHIVSPSGTKPNLEDSTGKKGVSELGQSMSIDKLLGGRRNGFFVECGAHDGEHLSNTLFFELERDWTGLLIEV